MMITMMTEMAKGSGMKMRISNRLQSQFLMFWHATFSGSFIVAYVSEDIYAMHMFAGYVVLIAVIFRVILGIFSRPKSPFALPNPMAASRLWLDKLSRGGKTRNPLFSWITAALLCVVGLAAATGAISDFLPFLKDFHEGVSELTLAVILGHLGFVFFKIIKKYVKGRQQAGNFPGIYQNRRQEANGLNILRRFAG